MNKNALGEAIRSARGEKSLRQFSREIGISHTHIDSIERGYDPRTGKPVNIGMGTLVKIQRTTGIDVSAFVKAAADK